MLVGWCAMHNDPGEGGWGRPRERRTGERPGAGHTPAARPHRGPHPRVAPPYGHARGRATPRGAQHRVSPGPRAPGTPRAHSGGQDPGVGQTPGPPRAEKKNDGGRRLTALKQK